MVEEIIKTLAENPKLAAMGAAAAGTYLSATYAVGRNHTFETTKDAEDVLEEGYSSGWDVATGLLKKGMMDSARADIESKYGDDLESYLEDTRYERQPVRGD